MYSPRVIEDMLRDLAHGLGFMPQRHSIAEVVEMNEKFDALWDNDQGRWRRDLIPEENRWISNEIAMSQCSFPYWATRYAYIRTFDERVVRFSPNIAQRILLDVWAEMQAEGLAIIIQNLKARQLGISTLWELAVCHRTSFWPNVNAVVGSSDPDKSAKMAGIMELAWQRMPRWMQPILTKYKAGELIEFDGINSGISIQHGSQMSGIARGTTPSVAHLSELADFKNPEAIVDASLLKAMHPSPNMLLALESTASGENNWWHKTWKISKAGWPSRRSTFRPMFFPWFVGTDLWPTKTWLRAHPIPANWKPMEPTLAHAAKAARYVASDDLLRKYLGENWTLPREQMWFYESDREEHKSKGELSLFLSEMPGDDEEAFQSRNYSIFDVELTNLYEQKRKEPKGVYAIRGFGIPERIFPPSRAIDYDKPLIKITANWQQGRSPLKFELVPVRREWWDADDALDKVFVWEFPEIGEQYVAGVDLAEGIGLDRSVFQMLRVGTMMRNDAQCAEFASSQMNALDMWPLCMALGTLFSVRWRENMVQPKMVVEVQAAGDNCQHELRKHGWTKFHQWVRLDNRTIDMSKTNKIGWVTNAWSRPLMIEHMVKYLRDFALDIHSKYFIQEMKTMVMNETVQRMKIRAAHGGWDDRFMALALALTSAHIMEFRGNRQEDAFTRLEARKREAEDGPDDYVPEYARATTL